MVPSDYQSLINVKKKKQHLVGRQFRSNDGVISAAADDF